MHKNQFFCNKSKLFTFFLFFILILTTFSMVFLEKTHAEEIAEPNALVTRSLSVTEYDFTTRTERTYNITYLEREAELNSIDLPASQLLINDGSTISPNVVIDDDYNRTFIPNSLYGDQPYSAVCKVINHFTSNEDSEKTGYHGGTSFIVGKKITLSVAHIVYDFDEHKWVDYLYVIPHCPSQYSIPSIFTSGTAVQKAIIPTAYKTQGNTADDWAIFVMQDDIGSENGTWQLLITTPNLSSRVDILGYPIGLNGMWHSYGLVIQNNVSGVIKYTCDTSGGNSGSPVYTQTTSNGAPTYKVVAIHSGGFEPEDQGDPRTPYNIGPLINRFITTEVNRLNELYS